MPGGTCAAALCATANRPCHVPWQLGLAAAAASNEKHLGEHCILWVANVALQPRQVLRFNSDLRQVLNRGCRIFRDARRRDGACAEQMYDET